MLQQDDLRSQRHQNHGQNHKTALKEDQSVHNYNSDSSTSLDQYQYENNQKIVYDGAADIDIMDTTALAKLGLVVIAVQYRLGIFGALNFDDVENLHVYDQIESLKWVNTNAKSFGGDPNNVTLMGQSAGGIAAYNMLKCSNLFKKAIIISAPIDIMAGKSQARKEMAQNAGEIKGTWQDLLNIQERVSEIATKKGNLVEAFSADHSRPPFGDFHEAELLIGWTADDLLPFLALHPAGQWIANVPYVSTFIGQTVTAVGIKRPAQKLVKQYHDRGWKATTYQLDWFPAGNSFRAAHCMEHPLIFDGWARWASAPLLKGATEEEVDTLGKEFRKMIYTFVTKGLPQKHITINTGFNAAELSK
ncbi:hypothetical protein MRB53_038870 [Persea americana]|nr:hypothetical protein MRB53_038870 [Persea americana]